MKIIRTAADLKKLHCLDGLPPEYLAYIESFYAQLEESLGDGEPDFSLDEHGFIVLLEAGDDPRRLRGIGLDRLEQGLLGTSPEFVEIIELEILRIYRLLFLYDNEYGQTFLSIRGQLDPETEAWLAEQAE